MYRIRETRLGFTLMELMVVIAIIAILSTIAIASFEPARKRARDSERVAEIAQIALALELFYNACRTYPDAPLDLADDGNSKCPAGVTLGTFLSNIPTDPKAGGTWDDYTYEVSGGGTAFLLHAKLEMSDIALKDDLNSNPVGGSANCTDDNGDGTYNYCRGG